jgi:WhiB family transcriptional regulator, redox-sensing transcriptional regulator
MIAGILPSWMKSGALACRGENPDLFFGEQGKFSENNTREAIRICGGCPVIMQCRGWALKTEDQYAILGGMTPQQRNQYRRELEFTKVKRR